MKINKSLLVKCIVIPLIVGIIASVISGSSMKNFENLVKPPLSPPGWLFPVVWTILYILMGVASYLVITSGGNKSEIQQALTIYGYQLVVNFLWPTFFFNFGWYLFAFVWLVLLWVLIVIMIIRFCQLSKPAGYLLLPYLLWVTFAGYLNFAIWRLN